LNRQTPTHTQVAVVVNHAAKHDPEGGM
jgi:hypothetical protein